MEAGTLFFEIFGPEGRQAFSRPPAFAHALAGQCLIKQVDFDSGLAYVLQQWIPFYQWSKSQLYGAWRTHEPDFMLPSFKTAI